MASPPNFQDFLEQLDTSSKEILQSASEQIWAEAGKIICVQGEPSDSMYIIDDGVAEVLLVNKEGTRSRNIAYLTAGDIFGEVGVLIEQNRTATVRANMDVYAKKISRENLEILLHKLPGFAPLLTRYLAFRLAATTADALFQSHCKQLRGTLPQFDLMVVMQTIRDSNADGELLVWSSDDELIGAVLIEKGMVEYARCAHLKGIEALWELIADTSSPGTFAFRLEEKPSAAYDAQCAVDKSLTDCLMEGAMKRDYFLELPEALRFLQGILSRAKTDFQFESSTRQKTAERIWSALGEGVQPMAIVWKTCEVSTFVFITVVKELVESGHIQWAMEA